MLRAGLMFRAGMPTRAVWMRRCVGAVASVAVLGSMMVACGDEVDVQGATANANTGGAGGASSSTSSSNNGGSGGGTGGPMTPSECMEDHHYPVPPDYDQFEPVMGSHCKGTNHQDITGVEKLVYLGDSITQGTFPTSQAEFYRTLFNEKMTAKFPGIEIAECAENGAQVGDIPAQIDDCFPGEEPKVTLIVMTMGGNDITKWPEQDYSQDEAEADAEAIANRFRDNIAPLKDPAKFPNGSFLIYANVYEFTDGTAELDSCPGAGLIGLSGTYYAGATALSKLNGLYLEVAVDMQADMIFMAEEFCGHGYKRETNNTCFIEGAELWFDLSCIHPNPTGHAAIADLFELVVNE